MGLLSMLFGGDRQVQPQSINPEQDYMFQDLPAAAAPQRRTSGGLLGQLFNRSYEDGTPRYGFLDRLGDAFLIQAGRDPMHRQQYEQRMQQQALGPNFLEDIPGAVGRVAQAPGGLPVGLELMKADIERGNAASTQAYREAMMQASVAKLIGSQAGRLNANNYKAVIPLLARRAQAAGIDLGPIPAEYDEDFVKGLGDLGVDRYRQQRLPLMERQLDISEQNAETNRGRLTEQGRHHRQTEVAGLRNLELGYRRAEMGLRKKAAELRDRKRKTDIAQQNANTRAAKINTELGLPPLNPADYVGKIATSPDGSARFRSNGKNWLPLAEE